MHPKSLLAKGLAGKMNILLSELPPYGLHQSKSLFPSRLSLDGYLGGFVGDNTHPFLTDSFIFGSYFFGSGNIIQIGVNPLFQWHFRRRKNIDGQCPFYASLINGP